MRIIQHPLHGLDYTSSPYIIARMTDEIIKLAIENNALASQIVYNN
jgi:hypothetical protein